MYTHSFKSALVLLVVCVGSALPVWAQNASSGTVAGSVSDQSNAMVAGATVTLTDTTTNNARSTATNATGLYFFADVNPGVYDISVSKAGFVTIKTEHQEVKVGANLNINLALQVGGANVVVEVSAVGNELQTMNATVGNTITSLSIDNLPSLGRDVSSFVELQPGVGPDGAVAGAMLDQNFFSLDGGNNSSDMDGSTNVYFASYAGDATGGVATQNDLGAGTGGPTGVMPTPQDSVEEFKVNTAGQTADFNSSAGAEVKVVTKRGTNAWHGTGYEYYKDNNWSSQSWQNDYDNLLTPGSAPLPSFHYSRFGGAIGGPLIPKELLGGKTYFFFNYEGFHFPNSETVYRNVPSPALVAGNITDPVTKVTTPLASIDPRGIGLDPVVSSIWSKYEPVIQPGASACIQSFCDGANILGFSGTLSLPTTSKFAVTRIDHDFSNKWHFMTSYRYFDLKTATDDQVDIGGAFAGDTVGNPVSQSYVPQQAWFWVAGLTTNLSSNTTNDLHYSFLRNYWAYHRTGDSPQPTALGTLEGALELFAGQTNGQLQDLGPYNVDTQHTRDRFWDGHDQMIRDDISTLKGNHLFQFGGTYQRNWDYHQRTDNGGGINYQPVYELGDGAAGSGLAQDLPICTANADISNCGSLTAAALGIVSLAQIAYTRSGSLLTLNPPLTPASDKSTIPFYNVYFSDTWHMRPTFSLTYGLGWTLEMPPTEATGKQVELVDSSDQPIGAEPYLAARKRAALAGQAYNPEIGFALVGNTENGLKYPYNPFYGSFSPRVAAAWSPHFDSDSPMGKIFGHEDTVVRAGYGRVFGRLNGVDLVLVPLLGTGLIQPVQNINPVIGPGAALCPGGVASCANNAFRIGTDGLAGGTFAAPLPTPTPTLPQPFFPGYSGNISAATASSLDPNFRPNQVDSVDFTIQRQLSRKMTLELGYIGRRITHEYQPININSVPYMMAKGGQQFSQAYRSVVLQLCGGLQGMGAGGCNGDGNGHPNPANVTTQAFFESAMNPKYCVDSHGNAITCTAAVVANETGNFAGQQVWSLWSDLDGGAGCPGCNGAGFVFGNTMMNSTNVAAGATAPQMTSGPAVNASVGYGNYNAGFASLKMTDWRGLTLQSNFTYSKALGTGAVVQADSEYTPDDPYNLGTMYGTQLFDRKFVYNFFFVYQPPLFKGQQGFLGRVLGGWTFSSIFTAGSGSPIQLYATDFSSQEYGAGDAINYYGNENAVPIGPVAPHGHAYYNLPAPAGFLPVNLFKDGTAEANNFRNPILGLDNKDGGSGNLMGLPYWNVDFSVKKSVRVAEGISMEFQGVFANVLNHNQWLDPTGFFPMGLFNPGAWGALPGSAQGQKGGDRQIEIGARIRF